ncbi:ABC transporter permease [Streptomyces melanogenes]|uniref:ABC transporter permease n=1 Tax=Streptomyces melanogenes TaxID=67326 RepID=UPI00167D6678|nr:ABC transporter permease [Streptomyces melanogenes]GGP51755.1 membrane protein [Streptomyces melanogenes]
MNRLRDLTLGARFALTGGREGWTRTLMTAIGVGLGVALLLATTALPGALSARDARDNARNDYGAGQETPAAADTMLIARTDTVFGGDDVRGRLVQPEGDRAPVPPGLSALPAPGTMVVSPELRDLLKSPGGKLLRERVPYKITGTIGDAGLLGPHELAYYAGSDSLKGHKTLSSNRIDIERIKTFPDKKPGEPIDPILALLIVIIFVVLLLPVAVFIAAAVRFGGDRRDKRLAALRLVGADSRMTRWIAAGEALAGSLLGLGLGTVFFLIARQYVGEVTIARLNVFPSDLNPSVALALLVGVAVPAAAVGVTLFALRGVVIEPLGVVRTSVPRPRRLWWRLLLPVVGLGLLIPMFDKGRDTGFYNQTQVIGGTVLLLIGVTALLPWLIETVVRRLGGGGVGWQLAVRRLQLNSGAAARLVNGIAVAVAGAIALQMLFSGIEGDYVKSSGEDTARAQLVVPMSSNLSKAEQERREENLKAVPGVTGTTTLGNVGLHTPNPDDQKYVEMAVGDCRALREVGELPSCKDGDVFVAAGGEFGGDGAAPGAKLLFESAWVGDRKGPETPYTVPRDARTVQARPDPLGTKRGGLLATPGAVRKFTKISVYYTTYVTTRPGDGTAADRVLNAAWRDDPFTRARALNDVKTATKFSGVRRGLYIGAAAVLMLIGTSLLVSMLEQLRERKRLLSSLVAFGTRRTTLSWSVLWQTAVPVTLGLTLASGVGLGLGAVLLRMVGRPIHIDWPSVAGMVGIGGAVVLLVTALSLPPLWRLMRPDGLRTE